MTLSRRIFMCSTILIIALGSLTPLMLKAAGGGGDETSGASSALYAKGVKKAKAGEYEEAEDLFARSIDQNKKVPESYNMLGYVQRKQGRYREAIQAYHRALELKPNFPEAREYLGEAYLQGAQKQLKRLQSTVGSDGKTYQELRSALLELAERYRNNE